jgi:DNA topoisomerase-2
MLNSLTRYLFPEADDAVLSYLNDDGTIVEPEYYVPIIPFALINGISGIGTGFSCNIAPYNPKQIIGYLKNKLSGVSNEGNEFIPYYEGFTGAITKIGDQKYLIKGKYEKINDEKIRITELPVGTWTMPYTTFLESLMDGTTVDKTGKKIPPSIKDFVSLCTEVSIDITIVFPKGKIQELESTIDSNGFNGIEKLLKLSTTVSTTNMHMFDANIKLHKYSTVEEIIDDFYGVRLDTYRKRKEYLVADMEKKLVRLSNRARYIQETLAGTIDLRRKTAEQVTQLLSGMKFALIEGDFKYLIKMPMDSVTQENVESIMKEKANTEEELAVLKATPLEKIWLNELDVLDTKYDVYKKHREEIQKGGMTTVKKVKSSKGK